ncbi:MAG: serine hydrolase [Asgard group archaeon]|nr:serine hydrolase [Asgard group archaeon]
MKKSSTTLMYCMLILVSITISPLTRSEGSNEDTCLPLFDPQVDDQIEEIMNQTYIPSVTTAVIGNNSIIWAKGYGEQQQLDLIYMIGSTTKTIIGTAILKLYEDGLLDLDDDVNVYLPFSLRHPNFAWIPITIRMLLTHHSGLNTTTEMYQYGEMSEALENLGWENPYDWAPYPDWIEEYLTPNGSLYDPSVWSIYKPGLTRIYTGFGYDILSYIIQLVSGKPVWDYLQEKIFDPLEMDNTGYNYTLFDESQLATPYYYMYPLDNESTGNKAYPHYNRLAYGSVGIRSNIYDLARYLMIHMHKGISNGTRILNETTTETMHQLRGPFLEPGDEFLNWGGWGGTEGDSYCFHTKAYCYYDGNTTVPYGVITFVNQGIEEARDACFDICELLRVYVHEYDLLECEPTPGFTIIVSLSSFAILMVLVLRKRKKTHWEVN